MMFYGVPQTPDYADKAVCCKIDCSAKGVWNIVFGNSPDDTTIACAAHVGYLLGDQPCIDIQAIEIAAPDFLEIVFDGPPSAVAGRFVEVEATYANFTPKSVNAGEWVERDDFWRLRIPVPAGCVTGA